MKLLILIFIGLMLGTLSCENKRITDYQYQSGGKITGPDIGMCICCGGWKIVIDNETYNFDQLPAEANIDLQKATFPIFVKLDWELKGSSGCPKWINIQRIQKE